MTINRLEEGDVRWYEIPGIGRVPSATTVLKALSKPALVGWAAKMSAEYMGEVLRELSGGMRSVGALTKNEIDRLVKDAKSAHRSAGKEAADIGSAVHAWVEIYYKMKLTKSFEAVPGLTPEIEAAIDAFRKWDADNEVVPICVEERIWSSERYAGTLDLYAEVKGVKTLIDFKSSKAHYPEDQVMQLGAYDMAFRERTGNRVDGYMVVRLDKLTGKPDPREYSREEVELGAKRFLALLKYWWLTESSNGGKL